MNNVSVRVGCYVRVSTENQLENYSIDEQKERLEAYCKSMGWKNFYFYSDPGYSGGTVDRPALTQLLKDISSDKINMVAVYKLDRLSRSQKDTLVLIEDEFLAKGVEFASVLEKFDTSTPFGRATLGMLSVFAQLEKDQITERFTMGRIGRSKAGYFHGGASIPKGYDYVDGKLIINEFLATQVREAFNRFLSGYSINSIYEYMHGKYGGWSHTNVYHVLKNSIYIGKVKFKGTEYPGLHEPIITREAFEKVQELLQSKEAPKKTPFRAETLLSSLVYCKRCGARYHGNHGYYKCYSRAKSDKKYVVDPDCRNDNWKIEELDDTILDEIRSLKLDRDKLDGLFSRRKIEPDNGVVLNKIKEIELQIAKLLDLYQIKNAPIEQISPRIEALQLEKEKLARIAEKAPQSESIGKAEFLAVLNGLDDTFSSGSIEEKRMFISYIIKSIDVDGNSIKINWRI